MGGSNGGYIGSALGAAGGAALGNKISKDKAADRAKANRAKHWKNVTVNFLASGSLNSTLHLTLKAPVWVLFIMRSTHPNSCNTSTYSNKIMNKLRR